VRPIVVPDELAALTTNPELSGIVWSPTTKRYLVVTDDAGLREEGTRHEPMLLAVGPDGAFAKKPVPIRGIKKLNDPESIAAGPDGSYFLVTSHSPNREGKTPSSRRQLLQLEESKGALRVVARMDLTQVQGKSTLLDLAGLPADGRLDIEAVTYHDGALFIGFKSPLTARGEAVVLRIARPGEALRAGKLKAGTAGRFVALPLCVEVTGKRVCQGISDMTFLPDGSLVLSANAPKGGPQDHGGALWHVAVPVDKSAPVLLSRFPELKPEGVTLSADRQSLVVVFDRDDKTPSWTELPLPPARSTPKTR
jgi:hypothetical protein